MQFLKFLALTLGASALAFTSQAEMQVRSETQIFYPGGATQVHIQLPFGSLEVQGGEGRDIEVTMRLQCSREDLAKCQERARRLRIVARGNGETLRIRLKNTGRGRIRGIKAELKVKVPHGMHLELDQNAGSLLATGMSGNLEVDSSAGDVEIRYPQDRAGLVDIKVGVGEVNLRTRDGSSLAGTGFPRALKWQGTGPSKIEIDMTAGDALVKLE